MGDTRLRCLVFLFFAITSINTYGQSQPSTNPSSVAFTVAPTESPPVERIDTTYQWSVEMPTPQFERRAYLWIPPGCRRVRGVVVGLQNMLEKLMFQNGDFRDVCAEEKLAIVYIAPGSVSTHKNDPALALGFKDPKEGTKQLQDVLSGLAKESGYSEIEFAPLITVGHSAATPFVWGYTAANPDRVIASLPYKGWIPGGAATVPILYTDSEWAEVGGPKWGECWKKDAGLISNLRGKTDALIGEYIEIGNGHYAWQPASAKILGMFIRKAMAARVPADEPMDGAVKLKAVSVESGVLVDPAMLGQADFRAYPFKDYPGDKKAALWYFDDELATAVDQYMAERLGGKPEAIDFLINGKPAPLEKTGTAELHPTLLDDGVTWKVQGCFLDRAPAQLNYGDEPTGHASAGVYFHCGSGALKQVGPDLFRVWLERGGVERQGNPWDPWIIATAPGDNQYRSADKPLHVLIDIRRKDGEAQTINFPQIPDQPSGTEWVNLNATASSGLPVQYFVVSGPVEIEGNGGLKFLSIPPRAKFPVEVIVGAYQWGRGSGEKFQSAGPVTCEFLITKLAEK
jgi:hypothetical protein